MCDRCRDSAPFIGDTEHDYTLNSQAQCTSQKNTTRDEKHGYCSSECQKADWSSHRKVCRSRQQLARAVSILTGLWAALQASTYAERCDFSHEDNGLIAAEHWKNDQDCRCYTSASLFDASQIM
ncbi:hypothetical protein V2G26_000476 [Clonostachys chloroleuca]